MELCLYHLKNYRIPWNSTEQGWCRFKWLMVPWNSMEYSIEYDGTIRIESGKTTSIWNASTEVLCRKQSTIRGMTINSVAKWNISKFHGIPWNLETAILNDISILWNYRDYSIISVGIMCLKSDMNTRKVPWNSMILGHIWIANFIIPWTKNSIISHNMMLHWISGNSPCHQIDCHRVPWCSMELSYSRLTKHRVPLDFHRIFRGIPWNCCVAKIKYNQVSWNSVILGDCWYQWHRGSFGLA